MVSSTRRSHRLSILLLVAAAMLVTPGTAMAWKPFAHNYTGDRAYADAVDDGAVTFGPHSYPVDARIVRALRDNKPYFNAGVVGPDGFPDLIYGQSQIHPVHTGRWLRYIVERAWAAQTDARYSADERAQILAFSYGFLIHAAGDMWGHTLVNDFAGGVFPSFQEFTDPEKAKIGLRHLVAEGYAGNATPGWDRGQEDRAPVCTPPGPAGTNCDDVSDDQTYGVAFEAPHQFIYNTLVDPRVPLPVGTCNDGIDDDNDGTADDGCPGQSFTVGTPEPRRGPLLDFFLDLEAKLKIRAAELRKDAEHTDCLAHPGNCVIEHPDVGPIDTVRGDKTDSTVTWRVCHSTICLPDPADFAADKVNLIIAAYLEAWVDDIETGVRHWSELSLGVTKALFDPQARRDAQNDECHTRGPESSLVRANCENAIGFTETLAFETNDYINTYGLSMLGAPDLAGPIREVLQELSELLDEIVGPALNPIRLPLEQLKQAIQDMIQDAIRDATGVDVEELKGFLTHPTRWMCGDAGVSITLPGVGTITGAGLFSAVEHERIDAIIGLEPDHHETGTTISTDCSPLKDDAEYDPNDFAAIKNTITQAKLALLDGTELNHALGDALADGDVIKSASLVHTYQPNDNVMFSALGTGTPWLELIDGDHAWRQDGLPRFCSSPGSCARPELGSYPRPPTQRPASLNGGTGRYPIWESCVLRPAFRTLFVDWENDPSPDQANFPDLGDDTSPDPATDANAPTIALKPGGATFTKRDATFVGRDATFAASSRDNVFTNTALALRYRVYALGHTPGDFEPLHNGASLTLPSDAGDGVWVIELRTADACSGATHSEQVTLDTQAPNIRIDAPAPNGASFDSNEVGAIRFSADDGALGSGVRSASVTLDGAPATNGQPLDFNRLGLGTHTIIVTAEDQVTNKSTSTRTFDVRASGNPVGGGPAQPGQTQPADRTPPAITGLRFLRRCVTHATLGSRRSSRNRLTLVYTLSEDAEVTYSIRRRNESPGRRHCPGASRGKKPGTYTTVAKRHQPTPAGDRKTLLAARTQVDITVRRKTAAGHRSVPLRAFAAARKLSPGTYLLIVQATDSTGNKSSEARIKFWVLAPTHRLNAQRKTSQRR